MAKFKKAQTDEAAPEQIENGHSDYAVKKSKRTYLIARILAFFAAFLLWIYVASTNTTTDEQDFNLVPITYREESMLKSEYGLIVQSISIDTLNVTLMGNKTDVRAISTSDVKAYVNLGTITKAGEYELEVYVDAPSGTTCVAQTVDRVVVNVDKPAYRTIALTPDNIVLSGWSLEKDCFFGDITVNTNEIVLEGPTLELEKVEDIELRTDVIGNASSSFVATASVHFLDSDGDELVGSGVSVQGEDRLQVSVEVLKTIKVELALDGKNGRLSDSLATISPAQVLLTGSPDALEGIKELTIGKIDETALTEDLVKDFPLSLEGVEITDEDGNAVTSAKATVRYIEEPPQTFTLTDIPVLTGDAIVGYLSVDVTADNADDAKVLEGMKADAVTVSTSAENLTGELDQMTVAFDKAYISVISDYKLHSFRGVE